MAPIKRTADSSPTSLKHELEKATNAELKDLLVELLQEMKEMRKEIAELKSAPPPTAECGYPKWLNLDPTTRIIADGNPVLGTMLHHSKVIQYGALAYEKFYVAVVEKLEDRDKTTNKTASDRQFVDAICDKAELERPTDVWRIPTKNTTFDRPLKIRFSSRHIRDQFLKKFRANCPAVNNHAAPTARRDLTPYELGTLKNLKRVCYEANQAEGLFKYYVRDLSVVEITSPQPLKSRSNNA